MFFWQRKEVLITFSIDEFNRAKDMLAANQIFYDWKITPECGRGRNRTMGTSFMDLSVLRQYYLYVNKKEYERAEHLVKKALTTG